VAPLAAARADVVSANRILGHEGILDAFGHVSVRHPDFPDRFLLSRARAPELVDDGDLLEFNLAGEPTDPDGPTPYIERFIHAAIYAARPDIGSVCHNHTPSILPFSVSMTPLRAVIHAARFLGVEVPVWDLALAFPGEWSPLVRNLEYGDSLATCVGGGTIALMRGHGSVVVGGDPQEVVSRCIAMDKNARVQETATRIGTYTPMHAGECDARSSDVQLGRASDNRAWEYLLRRAGLQ
jgi:ribulose-5-phosphate 4-epimerase/fuculose-1-phosphate aldolase